MTIANIALVESRGVNTHVFSKVYLPRLGLPILGAVLKRAGYNVELFYQEMKDVSTETLKKFDLVGFSTITPTAREAYRMADELRKCGTPVVMGGPHVTAMPEEALEHADFVVRGEGEETLLTLLHSMNNGKDYTSIPGISWRNGAGPVDNPPHTHLTDLTGLPDTDFSACHAFKDPEDYPGEVMFSRGCPYGCNFCSVTSTFGRRYRHKTVEQTLREVAPHKKKMLFFIDDNFAANPKHTKQLLKEMIDRKLLPEWMSCQLRIEASKDEELLELLKRARCRLVFLGLESVNPETLKQYNKGQSLEQMSRALETFARHRLGVHGMFVIGGKNDTPDTVRATVDFALENNVDTTQICALTPLPGTEVYRDMKNEDRLLHTDWNYYDGLHVVYRPDNMTPYEMQQVLYEESARFYSVRNALRLKWGKPWRMPYRLFGRKIVHWWKRDNAHYMEYLKGLN